MSGAATPHDPSQVITMCDGLKLMQQNVAALVDLRARQERLMAEAMQLQQDMVDFCAATREQVAALLARTPLELRPRRAKVNLDDDPESTEAERLPPPLQPQVVTRGGTPSGTMCRSLSDFLSNLTETACTNSSFVPAASEVVSQKVGDAVHPTESSPKPGSEDETAKSDAKPSDAATSVKSHDMTNNMPSVSVTAEDAAATALDTAEETSLLQTNDSASVSSLLLDSTMTSNADISLLDDPFIAIGAGCEKDSLLEEQDTDPSWTTDDSDGKGLETIPMTLLPDPSSGEEASSNVSGLEVETASADDSLVLNTESSLADTDNKE